MAPGTTAGKSLLLVDDDEATRLALASALQARGHTVRTAASGREALDILRREPPPDLILLDLMMPGMDGWEFRRRQQQDPALASIPVVVLSAVAESAQGAETLDAVAEATQEDESLGDVGFLQKPVAPDVLGVAVERFARAHRPAVLIVEDDVAVLRLVERALRHHGFNPVPASGGAEALALCRGRGPMIELALIDVQMPGMDGPQTLAALRQLNPRLQAVFMSGHTGKYSAEDLFATGAARVVQKPFPLAEVAQTLWALVAARANG